MKLAVCLLGVIMTIMLIVPGRAAETWTNFGAGVRSVEHGQQVSEPAIASNMKRGFLVLFRRSTATAC